MSLEYKKTRHKKSFLRAFLPALSLIVSLFIFPCPSMAQFMRNSAKECAICHFRWLDQFYVEGRGTDLVEYQQERVAGSEMICYSCHNGIMVDSRERFWAKRGHQCNMVPSKKVSIPFDMPLGAKKEVVCATCHTVHGVADELRYEETIYLRHSNKNSEMCMMCHTTKGGGRERGNHPIHVKGFPIPKMVFDNYGRVGKEGEVICETCHTVHGTIDKNLLVIPDRVDENIFTSELCEACHGANPSRIDKGGGMGSHPVDMEPKEVRIPSIWQEERKVARGRKGEILCQTCHWPHDAAPETSILAKKGEPTICLDCHKNQVLMTATDHDLSLTSPLAINIFGKTVKDSGICSPCHMPHNAGKIKLWSRKIEKRYKEGVSNLCISCHQSREPAKEKMTGNFSHPVERDMDRIGTKTGLPLFDIKGEKFNKKGEKTGTGRVTCSTCHNVHQWDPAKKEQGSGEKIDGTSRDSFLRVPDVPGSSLCVDCHQDKKDVIKTEHDLAVTAPEEPNYTGKTIKQAGVCSPCHLVHNGTSIKIWAREVNQKESRVTGLCSSCHQVKKCGEKKIVGKFTHPTEKPITLLGEQTKIEFPQYTLMGDKTDQKGFITCTSCHDPHIWSTYKRWKAPGRNLEGDGRSSFLRMNNNRDSSLCTSCHRQKVCILQTEHDLRVTSPKEVNLFEKTVKDSGVCSGCHVPHQAGGIKLFAKKIGPDANPGDRLCMPCHSKDGCGKEKSITSRTHPMPEKPKVSNQQLPLFDLLEQKDMDKGRITCSTCHDPHQWAPAVEGADEAAVEVKGEGKKIEGTGKDSFLRMASAPESELCRLCHKDQGYVMKTDHDLGLLDPNYTKGTCAACHNVHNGESYRLWAIKLDNPSWGQGPVDLLCQSCHFRERLGAKKVLTDGFSHPVNISLKQKGMKTDLPLYTPPVYNPMDQRYDKERGEYVTCDTCHDIHIWSQEEKETRHTDNVEGTVANSFLRQTAKGPGYICMDCHEDKKYLLGGEHDMRLVAPADKNILGADIPQGGVCAPCHAVHHAPKERLLWARSLESETDFMVGTCVNCHKKGGSAEAKDVFIGYHPSSFVYTGKIIEQQQLLGMVFNVYYPLYDKRGYKTPVGFVTCTTCHDPHVWDPLTKGYPDTKNIEGDPTNSFLRNKGPAYSICLDCHRLEALLKYKGYHQPAEWKEQYWRKPPAPLFTDF